MFFALLLSTSALLLLLSVARGEEIKIENMPKGVMWCGASHLLKFTYDAKDVPDGTQLRIVLSLDTFGDNEVITDLGTVTAPAKEFNIVLPQPFPADWLGKDKLKDNQGGGADVIFEVIRADKTSVNSYCGTFCSDPQFTLKCCPTADPKCGCDNCSCATGDVCNAGFQCGSNGKCTVDLPGAGELCPMGKCESNFNCQCPASNPSCQPTEKSCVDTRTCPINMATLPGKLNCPCSNPGMLCESGLSCLMYMCKANSNTPIASQTCSPASDPKNPDACMTHPSGSVATAPFSCQASTCKACAPGDRYCICNAGVCKNTADYCTQAGNGQRCFPRTGCLGCVCNPDSSCSDGGTVCVSNACVRPNTVAPTQPPHVTPTGVSCTQTPGFEGCPCLMQGGQVGCGKMGLVCKKATNTCESAAAGAASLALAAAVLVVSTAVTIF
jgi:hypothetical protein